MNDADLAEICVRVKNDEPPPSCVMDDRDRLAYRDRACLLDAYDRLVAERDRLRAALTKIRRCIERGESPFWGPRIGELHLLVTAALEGGR